MQALQAPAPGVGAGRVDEEATRRAKSKQAVCNTYGHGVYDPEFVRQMR